jgi:hypothetical protein
LSGSLAVLEKNRRDEDDRSSELRMMYSLPVSLKVAAAIQHDNDMLSINPIP